MVRVAVQEANLPFEDYLATIDTGNALHRFLMPCEIWRPYGAKVRDRPRLVLDRRAAIGLQSP
jgi:hypothetical protein